MQIKSNLVDIKNRVIYPALIKVEDKKIISITKIDEKLNNYILPGFIDSHIHIESSMLAPSEFARLAIIHGSVATVSDPHEIANILGLDGINFMLDNASKTNFKFFFGASPCVPATTFETSGATLTPEDIEKLLQNPKIKFLSEVMNFPGVLMGDKDMLAKIELAKKYNKPIDGHAPALSGDDLKKYINTPQQEFVEALVFYEIVKNNRIMDYSEFEEISLLPENYVLGLCDVIGELRRMVLESIKNDDVENAKKYYEFMEKIYDYIMKFDYYHVIDGLRRKQDISRSLLEKTNGDLVNFIENLKLRNEIKKLKNE